MTDDRYRPSGFEEDDATVMVPTFGAGYFFADRYRIDSLIGSGAMGRVYSATELYSERRVALKILHRERLGEYDTVERFSREAEVLASIGHPCIVEIYTFHRTADGTPYLAMELLEGVTLKTRLVNAGRFEDPRDFQEILDGICGALSAAHAHGVVHRDMKPDNIFLLATGDPRAKLVDFGLSRIGVQNKSLTASGMILGTPRYMAPEQIRDAASAGPPGDIYSVGVILYESLTGQSPYPAQDYGQLLGCVIEGRTNLLEEVRPDVPRALGDVVRRAMDPDQARRFGSADELADAYGGAIGVPSRRKEIAARQPVRRERVRTRIPSQQAMVASKGGTLALDLSAAMESLSDLPGFGGSDPSHAVGPTGHTKPFPAPLDEIAAAQAQASQPSPYAPPPPQSDTVVLASNYDQPAYNPPSPMGMPSVGGPAMQAGGPYYAPQPPYPSQPEAMRPRKSRGWLYFILAMVVVVVLSALGGFALKAYMKGNLELPFVQ